MLTAQQNVLLTQTGPGTGMGEVFRQYWQPLLLSRELQARGAPKPVKILGEDFVAFRDAQDRVGVIKPRCSHRGANLVLGRNEDAGLRCVYHGWQFDVAGRCIDIPTSEASIAENLKPQAALRALKVEEWCDVIWVHFGDESPDQEPPALPKLDFSALPDDHYFVSKKLQQCNWAQAVEGGIDTAHFSYLHANLQDDQRVGLMPTQGINEPAESGRYRWLIEDSVPQFTILKHDAGLVMCAARKADNEQLYWRLTQFLMPNHSMAPNSFPGDNHQGNTWVPIDDHSCWIFCYIYNPERPLTEQEVDGYASGSGIFANVDENYVPLRNRENNYLQDRDMQQHANFTGITGISEQDAAIADSQGLIADRTAELLGQTDLAIVRFRQMMFAAADAVQAGNAPHGKEHPGSYQVRSGDAMSPRSGVAMDVVTERFGELAGQNLTNF